MELSEQHDEERRICAQHGAYTAKITRLAVLDKNFYSPCPECSRENQAANRRDEEAQEKIEQEKRLRACGITPRFARCTFENYIAKNPRQEKALNLIKEYTEHFESIAQPLGKCLLLSGSPGTGKTHLCAAVAMQLLGKRKNVLYVELRAFLGEIKNSWRKGSHQTEKQILQKYASVDLLIVDEVGVQFDSDAEKLLTFDLINARYNEIKPTVLVSNYPARSRSGEKSIETLLGERSFDRLKENGGIIIIFDWESERR